MSDPFAPSSDPDIPTPSREDLLRHVHGSVRDQLAAGTLDAKHAENEWMGARRLWDEGHKRDAARLVEGEARLPQVKEIGLPLAGSQPEGMPPDVDSEFPGTFRDIEPLNDPTTGTRVIGQQRAPTEQEERDAKLLAFMPKPVRAAYNAADFDQKQIIWAANERAFEEAEERKEQKRQRDERRMADALDAFQRAKEDLGMAHHLPPDNATMSDIVKWYEDGQKLAPHVPFPVSEYQPSNPAEPRSIPLSIGDNLRTPEEIPLRLEDDVRKMADAVGSPDEKVSWIHRIPVWKELGPWLRWASGCFAFALGMTQVNEYAWAMLGLIGCGVCCLVQIYVWTASPNRFKNSTTKMFLACLSLALIIIAGFTVVRIKGKKAWSNLSERDEQLTRVPQPVPQEKPVVSPLNVRAVEMLPEKKPGTKVAGIEWKPGYKDLRVFFENPTEHEYKNIDLRIFVNARMVAVEQFTRLPGVTVIPPVSFAGYSEDKDGKVQELPVQGGFNNVRVLCEKLPKQAELEMILAIPKPSFEPEQKLKGIYILGTYEANGVSMRIENSYWIRQFPLPDSPSTESSTPATTLYRVLLEECRAAGAEIKSGTTILSDPSGNSYKVGYAFCADSTSKTKYLSFFLPESNRTFNACKFLLTRYELFMEKEGKVNKALAELKDAKRVVIYYESYMFPGKIDELKRDYEKAGLLAEFRAKDLYENKRIVPTGPDITSK